MAALCENVRLVNLLSACFCLRLVMRYNVRLVRLVIAQVIEVVALGNRKMCGTVCLYTTYITRPRLLARRACFMDVVGGAK